MPHQLWDYANLIRERGFRVTPQRKLILDAVCEAGGHTTPEEVYERIRVQVPMVNRATVYRTLDFLCEMRLVVAVQIGRRMYYEVAGEVPHHHLVCRACDKVEPLAHDLVEAWFAAIERERQFTVDMEHLALFGLCRKCREIQTSPVLNHRDTRPFQLPTGESGAS